MGDIQEDISLILNRLVRRGDRLWRQMTSPLRALPDVVIIGAQKGGTTSLYRYLCQHPKVYGALLKEVHYFDDNYDRNPLWYRSHFDFDGEGIAIEATPKYLFDEASLWRMSVLLPDVTLIAVLREPVARAYSHYRHVKRGMGKWGADHRTFEEAARADMRVAKQKRVLGKNKYEDIYHSYVRRGIYEPQIKRYKKVYGDNLIVVNSEEMFKNTSRVVNNIFSKLGIGKFEVEGSKVHGEGSYKKDIPIRDELESFFDPHNENLYEMINVDRWWTY